MGLVLHGSPVLDRDRPTVVSFRWGGDDGLAVVAGGHDRPPRFGGHQQLPGTNIDEKSGEPGAFPVGQLTEMDGRAAFAVARRRP